MPFFIYSTSKSLLLLLVIRKNIPFIYAGCKLHVCNVHLTKGHVLKMTLLINGVSPQDKSHFHQISDIMTHRTI